MTRKGEKTRDAVLGRMSWDASLEAYEIELRIGADTAIFQVSSDGSSEDQTLATARVLFPLLPRIAREATAHVTRALLPLKNAKWLGEPGPDGKAKPELSAEIFATRLSLRSFALYGPEPELEIWFDDGGLFFGHSVSVRRTGDGEYVDAGIEG